MDKVFAQVKWDKGLLFFGVLFILIATPGLQAWYRGELDMGTPANSLTFSFIVLCSILCFWLARPITSTT